MPDYVETYKQTGEAGLRESLARANGLNCNVFCAMPPGFWLELPLFAVVGKGSMTVARLLLEYGANPFLYCPVKKTTPYKYALKCGKREIAAFFKSQRRRHPEWQGMKAGRLN